MGTVRAQNAYSSIFVVKLRATLNYNLTGSRLPHVFSQLLMSWRGFTNLVKEHLGGQPFAIP